MNISSGINTYSSNLKITQPSELKTALQIQEQPAADNKQATQTDRSVPIDTERGTQIDINI